MRCLLFLLLLCLGALTGSAQEYFDITEFDIDVTVNKDASLLVREKIAVHFKTPRHGIFRKIPFKYKISDLSEGEEKAQTAWEKDGYRYIKIEDIKVPGYKYKSYDEGDYKTIRIGSEDQMVDGNQTYEISYTLLGAINFFSDFSELYLNITGNEWPVSISKVNFNVHFFDPLSDSAQWFVATGRMGADLNNTNSRWINQTTFSGTTNEQLEPYEGVTVGVRMPANYLTVPNYGTMGSGWLALPVISLIGMFIVWKRWGKDLPVTVVTQYYPPEGISPSVAGYLIDSKLDQRDLTALIPYWGAGGFIRVEESEKKSLFGLIKNREYKFIKLMDLPADVESFEKTMFDGLFDGRDEVLLSDLENSFYKTMNAAKSELNSKINREKYYVRFTRTAAGVLPIIALVFLVLGVINMVSSYPLNQFLWWSVIASSLVVLIFGLLMEKKSEKGNEVYEKLLGFREFIKSVEKDRLKEFLKQDENYFDKILPFAIVFDVADTWRDKLKGLDVPPPSWYSGYYAGNNFTTMAFMNNLNKGLNSMSKTFYSTPSSSGSSGGSFGGGGFSGGGFGGGGGGSW